MLSETILPILVGPTGVGKTAVAIELCERIGGEIVSADSLQVFRRLDIGTAKATAEEQARVRHHLVDIFDPDEEYSAARWAEDARRAIEDVCARGKTPLVVGGTGFYISALLFPERIAGVPPDPQLRQELEGVAARDGHGVLHALLQTLDANAATRLHPNDVPRIMRAIEVARHRMQNERSTPVAMSIEPPALPFIVFGLTRPREQLIHSLHARIEVMLEAGFMRELRELLEAGYSEAASLKSLGYKQMRPALGDETVFTENLELWKRDTRRYAKRQMTWFRHQLPVQWIEMENISSAQAAERIAQQLQENLNSQ